MSLFPHLSPNERFSQSIYRIFKPFQSMNNLYFQTPSIAKLKHFETIQSQEVLNIVPGSSATTTVNTVEIDRHRRTQSLDYRQVCKKENLSFEYHLSYSYDQNRNFTKTSNYDLPI